MLQEAAQAHLADVREHGEGGEGFRDALRCWLRALVDAEAQHEG